MNTIRRPLVIVAGLFVLGVLLACGARPEALKDTPQPKDQGQKKDADEPKNGSKSKDGEAKSQKVDWASAGPKAKAGDVSLTVVMAENDSYLTNVYEGKTFKRLGTMARVEIKATNNSATKNVRFGGWNDGSAKLEDEHGNEYRYKPFDPDTKMWDGFGQGFKLASSPAPSQLRAGSSDEWNLRFEPLNDAAKEVRLTLPAAPLAQSGVIRLRAPVKKAG